MKTVYIKRNDLFKNVSLVLCNTVENVDSNFMEDNFELYSDECEACEGLGEKDGKPCEECSGDGRFDLEIYQSFLCHLDDWTQERFKEYGVRFGYSEALETHVLPIYDYGTSWSAFSYSKEVPDDYELSFDETLKRETSY